MLPLELSKARLSLAGLFLFRTPLNPSETALALSEDRRGVGRDKRDVTNPSGSRVEFLVCFLHLTRDDATTPR